MPTTQRQPSQPRILIGTRKVAISATAGTAMNMMNWLKAKARPRVFLSATLIGNQKVQLSLNRLAAMVLVGRNPL
jgi:hypothetical protein